MNLIAKIKALITNKRLGMTREKSNSAPLLIIKKVLNDSSIKEYKSIEDAIEDLENDPNVPKEKLEKLRTSLKNLKSKTSIKIMNGEIIK